MDRLDVGESAAEENEEFCRGGLRVGREYGIICDVL